MTKKNNVMAGQHHVHMKWKKKTQRTRKGKGKYGSQ